MRLLRNIGALTLLLLFSAACQSHPLRQKLQSADKVKISFHKLQEGRVHKGYKTLVLRGNKLTLIRRGILSSSAPQYKCSYNGSMIFYRHSKALHAEPMSFNVTCPGHIVYTYQGELYSLKLSPKLKSFLKEKLEASPKGKAP
jgi:hypothetical protein